MSPSPPPTSGKTSRPVKGRKPPSGTAWSFAIVWRKSPASTCAKARRCIWKAVCAPANGPTRAAWKSSAPKSTPIPCRCSAAARAWGARKAGTERGGGGGGEGMGGGKGGKDDGGGYDGGGDEQAPRQAAAPARPAAPAAAAA